MDSPQFSAHCVWTHCGWGRSAPRTAPSASIAPKGPTVPGSSRVPTDMVPCSLSRTCSFRGLICLHINLPFRIFGPVFRGRPSFSRLGWTSLTLPFRSLFPSFPALTLAFWKGEQVSDRVLCPIQEAVPAWRPGFLAQVTTDLYPAVFF